MSYDKRLSYDMIVDVVCIIILLADVGCCNYVIFWGENKAVL